jgi:hypothetical protein
LSRLIFVCPVQTREFKMTTNTIKHLPTDGSIRWRCYCAVCYFIFVLMNTRANWKELWSWLLWHQFVTMGYSKTWSVGLWARSSLDSEINGESATTIGPTIQIFAVSVYRVQKYHPLLRAPRAAGARTCMIRGLHDVHRTRILRVTFEWHMRQIHVGRASHPRMRAPAARGVRNKVICYLFWALCIRKPMEGSAICSIFI